MMQPMRLSLLGTFKLTVNGVTVNNFHSNKGRALLAYLLLAPPQPLLRNTVSTLLWADYADQAARANLRQTLSNLRSCLALMATLLHSDHTHLRFEYDPALVWCDVRQFEELLDACAQHDHRTLAHCVSCQGRLQAAVALYQGPLLATLPATDSTPFNDWLQRQRARLAARLAEAQAALAASAPPLSNLPLALTPLVGRSYELTVLEHELHHARALCVTLLGPGGIGKTRLACALGERLRPHFPAGVWLVALSGLAPTTPDEQAEQLHNRLATAIGLALGMGFYGATPPTVQVMNYLTDKTALLILDSFEHLAAGAPWLTTLLTVAHQLRLLITTRHDLLLPDQLVYRVEGLGVPPEDVDAAVSLLAQYSGVQLFVERARSAALSLALDPANLATVGRLCRFVEGSPWAIELAVAMLDGQPPAAILAALQANYRALTADLLDVPARHRSAEAVFLTAWRLLTAEEAQALARCAVFRGRFTVDAAHRVAAVSASTLEALIHKSLLRQSAPDCYTMHDLVRQFAAEQLAHDAQMAHHCSAAHAAYFTALLATWQPDDVGLDHFGRAVTQDWENVQAAWNWAVDTGAIDLMQQAVVGLAECYDLLQLPQEADTILGYAILQLRRRLATTAAGAPADHRSLQTLLAHLLWRHAYFVNAVLTEPERGAPLARELITLAYELGDDALAARGYYELSTVAYLQGDSQRQEEMLLQALPMAQRSGTRYDQILCLNMLGIVRNRQGDVVAALTCYRQALALTQGGNYAYYDLMVLNNIGSALVSDGQFSAAMANFQQALARAMRVGFRGKIAFVMASLGELAYLVGDYGEARTHLIEAQQRYADLYDQRMEAEILILLAKLFAEAGDEAGAQAYCQRALATTAGQLYTMQYAVLCTLGHLYCQQGQWAAAADVYQQALTLSLNVHWEADELFSQTYLAAVALAQGDAAAALALVEPLLARFAGTPFVAQQRPQALLWIAYQILVANADPRAPAILQQAWQLVQQQLAQIDEPRLRQTFLTQVPVNQQLMALMGNAEQKSARGVHRAGRAKRHTLPEAG